MDGFPFRDSRFGDAPDITVIQTREPQILQADRQTHIGAEILHLPDIPGRSPLQDQLREEYERDLFSVKPAPP